MAESETSECMNTYTKSLTFVSVIAIISIMICCLASLGFNSKLTVEKEKIEVTATNFNLT